jgi:hypothetical protein
MTRKLEEFQSIAQRRRRVGVDQRIAERGLRVTPFGKHGAYRIVGEGTDILLNDWRALTVGDLDPVIGGGRSGPVH